MQSNNKRKEARSCHCRGCKNFDSDPKYSSYKNSLFSADNRKIRAKYKQEFHKAIQNGTDYIDMGDIILGSSLPG